MRRAPLTSFRKSSMPHALRRALLASVVGAALLPGGALAAVNATRTGTTLTVSGATSGFSSLGIDYDDGAVYVGADDVVLTAGDGCTKTGGYLECGAGNLTALNVSLTGDGDDELTIGSDPFTGGAVLTVSTGAGDDEVTASISQKVIADLGSGSDTITTGAGADEVHGGPGNDNFALGGGNDKAWGDDGNDRFEAEYEADGADEFDGGADAPTESNPWAGDTISYANRATAITVVLPDDAKTVPEGANGGAAEGDRLAHVENAVGSQPGNFGEGPSSLTGNNRNNRLRSGMGNDLLVGGAGNDHLDADLGGDTYEAGDGDDFIEARHWYPYYAGGERRVYEDIDTRISCGGGNDGLRRDPADEETFNCEHHAPFLIEVPRVTGSPQVSSKLSVSRGKTFGEASDQRTTWYSCEPAGRGGGASVLPEPTFSLFDDGCRVVGTDATYAPTEADLARVVFANVELAWPYGEGAIASTPDIGPILKASPTPPGGGTKPPAEQNKPGGPFGQAAATLAVQKLGTGAFASNVSLGGGTAFYESPLAKGGTVTLRGAIVPAIGGVACEKACSVTVTGSLVLVPKAKKAKKKKAKRSVVATAAAAPKKKKPKKAKNKTYRLATQTFKVAAGEMGVAKLNVTAAQRKLIKKARKAKVTLAYELKYADGTVRNAKKSYVVKVG